MVRFIVVAFLIAFTSRDAAAKLRVAPHGRSRAGIAELLAGAAVFLLAPATREFQVLALEVNFWG
jgi:hypothetical protein